MANERLLEKLRKQISDEEKRGSSTEGTLSFLKFEDGEIKQIRILPPVEGLGASDPFVELRNHWGMGPRGMEKIQCPRFYDEPQPCPVCERIQALRDSTNDEDINFISRSRLSKRYVFQVLVRGEEEEGSQLWETSYTVYTDIRTLFLDPDYGLEMLDTEEGFDLKIQRIGAGLSTKYSITPRRNSSPIDEDSDRTNEILESRINLDTFGQFKFSREQIVSFMDGIASPREIKSEMWEAQKEEYSKNNEDDDLEFPLKSIQKKKM